MSKNYQTELITIEAKILGRRKYLTSIGQADFIEPKDDSTAEFMRAIHHNLLVRVTDEKYLALCDRRNAILETQRHAAMVDLTEALINSAATADYTTRFAG